MTLSIFYWSMNAICSWLNKQNRLDTCTLRCTWYNCFNVIKSPKDASMKLEGDRHQNGLKIDKYCICSPYYEHNRQCKAINTWYYSTQYIFTQEWEGQLIVKASDGTSTYLVTQCSAQTTCVPQCTTSKCTYLYRQLIKCTSWDYQEAHLSRFFIIIRRIPTCAISWDISGYSASHPP